MLGINKTVVKKNNFIWLVVITYNMIHLAPFGYDPSHIIAGIVETGIADDDTVTLIIPEGNEDDERHQQAKNKLEDFLANISDATITTLPVNHKAFHDATLAINDYINNADQPITLYASQGAREILVTTLIASLYAQDNIKETLLYSNIDRRNLQAELPAVTVDEPNHDLLLSIDDGMNIQELADKTGKDKSTVSRHIKRFEEQHLVTTETQGRKKTIRLAFTGKLLKKQAQHNT